MESWLGYPKDHYVKDGICFFKARYFGETLVEDDTMEVWFEYPKKDVPIELARYIRNHVVEAFRRKVPFNAWAFNVLKCHTRAIRRLYSYREIDMSYRLDMSGR